MSSYVVRYKAEGQEWRCAVVRGAKEPAHAVEAVSRAKSLWTDNTEVRVEPANEEPLFGAEIIDLEETPKT